MLINKRKIKQILCRKNEQGGISVNFKLISQVLFMISFILFLSSQLLTNAILSPLGHELQAMNTEKNLLLEDNRSLEQEIAKDSSLTIIKAYSKVQFEIKEDSSYKSIFVTDKSLHAER